MRLLWNYVKQYQKVLYLTLGLATINQFFSLLDPQIFRLIIDNYASKVHTLARSEFLTGVGILLAGAVGVAFVSRVAKNFQDYYVNVIVQKVGTRIYSDSVSHSFSLPYSVFEDQRSGEFLQKLQKARTDSEELIRAMVNTLFLALVGIVLVLAYAFYVNWLVGLVFFSIIPSLGTATYFISRKIKAAQQTIIKESAGLAGATTETIRNVELVKSLGLEGQEIKRLNDVNEKILALELKKVVLVRKLSFFQGTMINALRSSLMLLMLWLIFVGSITLGQFFSLLFYSFAIFQPLGELGNVTKTYQETNASMERLGTILATPAEPQPVDPVPLTKISDITFKAVSFKYPTADAPALHNIDFKIKSGETAAFVGPSGSGKTTIIKLMVGLYDPTEGQVEIDGIPFDRIEKSKFREHIGLVSQDTQLFAGTIRENLLFASPKATDEECITALRSAVAMPLVERGKLGLETRIGEGGLKLSGGEKQRLAIARALLRNPDMIIFDEATSSLDSLTEGEITETIKTIKHGRPNLITVLVAHRLSTVAHADTIFVLEKGHIIETGTAQRLLNSNGLYAALWRQQIATG